MLQTILFPKNKFSNLEAIKWTRDHGHIVHKIDLTDKFIRIRQKQPFPHGEYYTITLKNGVELVYEKTK
jgi:hypothetical protein